MSKSASYSLLCILILLLSSSIVTTASAVFQQSSGSDNLLVMEAENFHNNVSQGGHNWTTFNSVDASGGVAMEATPNNGTNNSSNYVTNSPRLDFNVNFVTTGTHYVWVRGFGANGGDDSVHLGLNGVALSSTQRIDDFTHSTWDWTNLIAIAGGARLVATIEVTSTGNHTINAWMREDGFRLDKLFLTTNSGFIPTGDGPAESPQGGGGSGFQQSSGSDNLLVMEAENFHNNVSQGGHNWTTFNSVDASGGVAMEATPNNGTNNSSNYVTNSPRLDFNVNFVTTGTHYVWVRGFGANGGDDSVHLGLNGVALSSTQRIDDFTHSTWDWTNLIAIAGGARLVATIEVTSTGNHTINAWMREDGFRLDKLFLTTNSGFIPTGDGPAESPQGGGGNNPPTITNPGNQTNVEGDTVSLQIQANDPDPGDILTYSASGLPTGLSINSTTGLITGTTNTANSFSPTVTVSDNNGGSNFTSFTWTVNTNSGGSSGFQQSSGSDNLLVMEAENFHNNVSQGGHNWTTFNSVDASGGVAMEATPNNGTNNSSNYVTNSPRLDFNVNFVTTGTHYVWVRGFGANGGDDSVHLGLNGVALSSTQRIDDFTHSTWDWTNLIAIAGGARLVATIEVTSTGNHTINAWMREDGFRLDKLFLTTNSGFIPTGDGPAESPNNGNELTLPYTENFDDGIAQNWVVIDETGITSNWSVVNNEYKQQISVQNGQASYDESYHLGTFSYLNTGFALTDYRISADLTPTGAQGNDIGIMFRYQDADNYYRLTLNSRFGFSRLEKKVGGQFTPLLSNSRGFTQGQVDQVTIELSGSSIFIFLDGDPLFSIDDNSLSSGTIALFSIVESSFDNVLIENTSTSPLIVISKPVAHSVDTSTTINASAIVLNAPAGGRVDFVLDGSTTVTDSNAPYTAQFNNVLQGNHTITAELYNSGNTLLTSDSNNVIGIDGDFVTTVGDSITNGSGDNYQSDNISNDNRIVGMQGYQAELNNLLTQTRGFPHLVVNEGIGGARTYQTVPRIDSILARNSGSNQLLLFLGTNDAGDSIPVLSGLGCNSPSTCAGTFKQNMQDIIDAANTAGNSVFVASTPPSFGSSSGSTPFSNPLGASKNILIQEYNQVIVNELTGINLGPDLFKCYLGETNQFSLFRDNLHPNALGHAVLSQLWHDLLTGATQHSDPCPLPIFVLENLSDSSSTPYHKQNLIEVGDKYYVDETFTITSIPSGLGLNNGIWIMTANSDSSNTDNNYLSFDVDRNITVYVAYDSGASSLPNWLGGFSNTGEQLQVSQSGTSFNLYNNNFTPGTVTLGGNLATGASGATANYIVIVVEQ